MRRGPEPTGVQISNRPRTEYPVFSVNDSRGFEMNNSRFSTKLPPLLDRSGRLGKSYHTPASNDYESAPWSCHTRSPLRRQRRGKRDLRKTFRSRLIRSGRPQRFLVHSVQLGDQTGPPMIFSVSIPCPSYPTSLPRHDRH